MQVDHNTIVRVHPAAIASIVDGHERREARGKTSKNNFILGTLMGTSDSKLITIDQAFTVDFSQKSTNPETGAQEEALQYDFEYHFDRINLIRAANKDSNVMGWFTTANEIQFGELDKMVSDLYFNPREYNKDGNSKHYGIPPAKGAKKSKPICLKINCEALRTGNQ